MSAADLPHFHELIVGPDGSIPAEQISRLGLPPGTHLRVVVQRSEQRGRLRGSLPDFPELTWEDFQRGSRLALSDLDTR